MTVGVITQARMTSTRLPGKVLMKAGGVTMLSHHVTRLQRAGLAVHVATTTNATDDPLVEAAGELGVPVHRGSEDDVLGRYADAAREFGLDVVVRVTSDCPLIDGAVVAEGVRAFEAAGDPTLYLSNSVERTYPRGFDFEVFSAGALLDADRNAREQAQREHVTPYLYSGAGSDRRPMRAFRRAGDASAYRVTLDTADDFELIRRLIEEHDAAGLGAEQIIDLLDRHPELVAINAHVEQKRLTE
ncbi:spore coat polysaccharide biosynthesis protein SpsF [Nocardioides terrae]|uniref:Spore coat polysaccharide biosynthesis protein SpsF n=1 Tax=Nocardioides terrae TaxID=574651 RepID=A0A1I1J310_9ACTN|nr:glycosyltransferase family protein [Nocardioides terrae]SFC42501.1 spore coat polysaccharide biosynthesis protein SpsF [Nocardioides terrae]